jgi:fructokinase
LAAGPTTARTTAPASGGTIPCPFPPSPSCPADPATADATAAWRPGSGRAFEAQYLEHTGETLKAREIVELKRRGDRLAGLLWHAWVDRVARGLAAVVNTLDPDVLVMGGGMSNVDELYDDLPRELARRTFSTVFHTPVLRARHGDSSGVRGAARLWK